MAESAKNVNLHLTRWSLLGGNVVWNLLGNGALIIVAVFSLPALIHGLGQDRFAVLALAWVLVGYACLFDLGLGWALTQLVAKKLGPGQEREVPSLVWTSLQRMLLPGGVRTAVIVLASPYLAKRVARIPQALPSETLRTFYLLALSIPVNIKETLIESGKPEFSVFRGTL
jgi:O-antigen/teichoic acid export membrane protein